MIATETKNKISKQTDAQIDKKQILSAIKIIRKLYTDKKDETKNLFELTKNPFIYMNFIVNKLPNVSYYKDTKINIPNSIYSDEFESKNLFILTNEFKNDNKKILSELKGNWTFVRYDKIKKNFKEYKDKRGLLNNYDLFFCDKALIGNLKKSLGVKFFERKKYPLPVDLSAFKGDNKVVDRDEFKKFLGSLVEKCTYLHLGQGSEFSIKIGRAEKMSDIDILKNALSAFKEVVRVFKQLDLSLKNIRRVVIRAEQSESLPVYTYLTEEEKSLLGKALKRKESK